MFRNDTSGAIFLSSGPCMRRGRSLRRAHPPLKQKLGSWRAEFFKQKEFGGLADSGLLAAAEDTPTEDDYPKPEEGVGGGLWDNA